MIYSKEKLKDKNIGLFILGFTFFVLIACNDGKHQKQVKPKQDVKNHDLSF